SFIFGERFSVRFPKRIVPICVRLPTGCASPRLIASTPATTVVLTAPRPTSKIPSFPSAGAMSTPFSTIEILRETNVNNSKAGCTMHNARCRIDAKCKMHDARSEPILCIVNCALCIRFGHNRPDARCQGKPTQGKVLRVCAQDHQSLQASDRRIERICVVETGSEVGNFGRGEHN